MRIPALQKIRPWLTKPFPFYENHKQKLLIPVLFTLLVMLGILALNYNGDMGVFLAQIKDVLTYGAIIIIVSLVFSLVLPAILPKVFDSETWNVQKTIMYFVFSVLAIGFFISIFAYLFGNHENRSFFPLLVFILKRSVVLSFFPILIIVFYAEKRLYKKNHLYAMNILNDLNGQKKNKKEGNEDIFITFAKGASDELRVNAGNLLLIKAEGNYCLVVYEDEGIVKQRLIRSSLKNIEQAINKAAPIIRCHKSYIINRDKITDVSGNAKGYLFSIGNRTDKIPVSRSFSKSLIEKIKKGGH